ncbi:MAG TPA: helix-turn-helix domain-containing protein [Micromonosporaceae bacterium]|nr:helix-turn-helix domain-containing protein [Micromonosporaceae bacterium]
MTHPPAGPVTPPPPPGPKAATGPYPPPEPVPLPPQPTGPSRGEGLLPVAEVAKLWRCSAEHIYELIRRGELRSVDIGNGRAKTRVPESALAEYIGRRTRNTPPAAGCGMSALALVMATTRGGGGHR